MKKGSKKPKVAAKAEEEELFFISTAPSGDLKTKESEVDDEDEVAEGSDGLDSDVEDVAEDEEKEEIPEKKPKANLQHKEK